MIYYRYCAHEQMLNFTHFQQDLFTSVTCGVVSEE